MRADSYITSLGFAQSFRVGGSVRDELLGRKPKDADYVIQNASLDALRSAVARSGGKPSKLQTRDGRQVGVRANVRGLGLIEIVLPRTEISTGPRHTDFEIVAEPNLPLEQDAYRRDFTINALYRNVRTGALVDPLNGALDIERKLIRTTHSSSFRDDPLRIMRALRFVSVLGGFTLEKNTYDQMVEHADACDGLTDKGVSGTALDELCKLLMGRRAANALRLARETGVLARLLPELEPMFGYVQESRYHDMTADEHTFTALDAAAGMHLSLRVRLALLFHDSGKPASGWDGPDGKRHYYENKDLGKRAHEEVGADIARAALIRLNAPRTVRQDVVALIERHMVPVWGKVKPAKVRRWRADLGDDLLSDLLKHRLADVMGKGTIDNDKLLMIARLEGVREDAQRAGVPTSVKELSISGRDLLEMGLNGPEIGRVQRALLHEVVSQPDRNDREWLLERARRLA